MQPKKYSNSSVQNSGRRATGSRVGTQPQVQANIINNNTNSIKERDEALNSIVKQYLDKSGYAKSFQLFKNQKPIKKIIPSGISGKQIFNGFGGNEQRTILNLYDKGSRDEFFKQTDKLFAVNASSSEQLIHSLRKLQFQLNIYFCIYNIHPCTPGSSKKNQVDKSSAEAFKRYIDAKGPEVSQQSQLLTFFALPYIPKPQQNPSMAKVFTKQWVQRLRVNLNQALRQFTSRNTANSNKQNKKGTYQTTLHEIYDRFLETNVQMSRIKSQQSKQGYDPKIVQKYERQIQELTLHNKQMISYLDILQQNLKDLNQASKTNLVQSNRKWFQFSKQILHLTKKALKGQNVKDRLQTYERFFGTNIEELIYCTDQISLFQKNSYTQDASMIPGSRNANNRDRTSNNHGVQMTPIDLNKISNLFAQADKPEYELQICLVLKALKQRLCYHKNAYLRRQVVVSYQRNDLCALKQNNYHIQKKLLLESSEKVKQFYLRLMNYISTDDLGNQYLSASQKLIQNLMGLMGTTTQQIPYRKHVIGILQKLSFLKQSQLMMISFGIIPMIFKIFRNEGESLHDNTIQYLMGLIMNLAVRKQSIINFQKHKTEILQILMKFIKVDDNQVKGYVNGTLYVLLQLQSIKKEALEKYKIKESLIALLNQSNRRMQELDPEEAEGQNCIIRQYTYILERLNEPNSNSIEVDNFADYDDDEDEQFAEDLEDAQILSDSQSNSSQIIDGEDRSLSGQELLMKKYALLGPEAVRQQIINRSILDQTGRKSNNMTTSINHSKRIDKVFHKTQRPETPSLLPGSLDLSITPNR